MKIGCKNMKFMLLIMSAGILLAGCGPKSFTNQQGQSQQQYYRDNSECMAMSQTSRGFGLGGAIRANRESAKIYDQCMMGKGYSPE